MKEGHEFESETDTETVAKLIKHVYDLHKDDSLSFSDLVTQVIQPLVGRVYSFLSCGMIWQTRFVFLHGYCLNLQLVLSLQSQML